MNKKYILLIGIVCIASTVAFCLAPYLAQLTLVAVPTVLALVFSMSFTLPIEIKRTAAKKPFAKYLHWCLSVAGCALISSLLIDIFFYFDFKLEIIEILGILVIALIVYVFPLTCISAIGISLSLLFSYIKTKMGKSDRKNSFGSAVLNQSIFFIVYFALLSLSFILLCVFGNENVFIAELLLIPVPPIFCAFLGQYRVKREHLLYSCLTYTALNFLTFILYTPLTALMKNADKMDSILNININSINISIIACVGQIAVFCIITVFQFCLKKRPVYK